MTNTPRSARLAGFMLALMLTAVINGAIAWKFDDMAQQAQAAAQTVVSQNHGAGAKG